MDGFVLLVRFELRPGTRAAFEALVKENARAAVRDEPGCRRFDVLTPRDGSDRVILYEVYDDSAALEAHRQTPHFAAFRAASGEMVLAREVEELDLTENAAI